MEEAIKTLLHAGNEALIAFTKRNLIEKEVDIEELWTLPRVKKLLEAQQSNGSWIYPTRKQRCVHPQTMTSIKLTRR